MGRLDALPSFPVSPASCLCHKMHVRMMMTVHALGFHKDLMWDLRTTYTLSPSTGSATLVFETELVAIK